MDESKPMKALTRIREERGLSQQGLADASGVNKATINQIERGRRSPNARTLEKLAVALGVEVADLFPKAEAPSSQEKLFNNGVEGRQPKKVQGSMDEKVDARTFEILAWALTGEVLEVIDRVAAGELARDEAREEVKARVERVLAAA